ncbi:MAG: hypothetical protein U1E26_03845 [Coriobacteriia bacterium]|nr:hypothetical protein [Coriobacteriia bacterium]
MPRVWTSTLMRAQPFTPTGGPMRHTIRILLTLTLGFGALVGAVGTASAEPVRASAGYTISGSVYAMPPIRPLNEVAVALHQSNGAGGWNRIRSTVPSGGAFQFNDVPAGDYRVGFEPLANASSPLWRYPLPVFWNNYASTVESATSVRVVGDTELAPIAIFENSRVSGTLQSAVDGAPLKDAAVTLYWFSGAGAYRTDTVLTDRFGEYSIYVPRGDENSFSLRFAKSGYVTEFYDDRTRLEDTQRRSADSWEGLGGWLRARITASVTPSVRTVRGRGAVRFTTVLRDGRSTSGAMARTGFRLQRSYNNRTWTNVGGELKTGITGRYTSSILVTRTTFFRALPTSSSKFYGVPSPSVKITKR